MATSVSVNALRSAMNNKKSETEMESAKRLAEALSELGKAGKSASEYGLDISPEAIAEIRKLGTERGAELSLWLCRDQNFDVAHRLMGMSPEKQVEEIRRLAKREDVIGSINDGDTETYIDNRKQARREGRRR
jgi:hypothetical protein